MKEELDNISQFVIDVKQLAQMYGWDDVAVVGENSHDTLTLWVYCNEDLPLVRSRLTELTDKIASKPQVLIGWDDQHGTATDQKAIAKAL